MNLPSRLAFCIAILYATTARADDDPVARIDVSASRTSQIGIAESASEGVVTRSQLAARTVYRPAELLETAPGLIVSQHSGEGKANQFYLRGFNLDHGTDLRTSVDGMLVNQRSHAHGQGWTDLNFLIPELAARLDYRKGPYNVDAGDFAAAGTLTLRYADTLDHGVASVGVGQHGFRRALLADSPTLGDGSLLYALEAMHNDGPFTRADNYRKLNGVLRYSEGTPVNGWNVTAMAYRASWNASDQIPQRAVADGRLGRFDTVDPSDGGSAHRYSMSGGWRADSDAGATTINASLVANQLDLYSNFTYFLNDPVHGDQFNQPDRRVTAQLAAEHRRGQYRVGLQLQNDNIDNGLYRTAARQRLSTVRQDHIVESSIGVFADHATRWSSVLRSVEGVRLDHYDTGNSSATRASPALSLIAGPWQKTELYFNAGAGFHSNDARGGDALLAGARGVEVGVRSEYVTGLQSALSLYRLDVDSELVFVGDAGTTAAGRASRRSGVEFSNYYKPNRSISIDADLAFARARFRDGAHIPGAAEGVASLALAVDRVGPWSGALQLRYFGPRPLVDNNTVRSRATSTINGRIGYQITPHLKLALEGYNLANRRASAVDYFYASRLAGETGAVEDVHFHPVETRSFRVILSSAF
ncbi:MAG: TonB-dependent receptor [Pseudomonadota bacterium]